MPAGRAIPWLALLIAALPPGRATAQGCTFPWAVRVASTVNPDDEFATKMAVDAAGNAYVTGWFDGAIACGGTTLTSQGGQDVFVAKYDPFGNCLWADRAGGATGERDGGRGIAVDGTGNIYVTGEFLGTANFGGVSLTAPASKEFFLVKYGPNGNVLWAEQSTGGWSSGVYGTGLAVDAAGNSWAVGYADGGAPVMFGAQVVNADPLGYGTFLVKYDAAGRALWAQMMSGPGHTYGTTVAVDAAGNAYVCASFTLTTDVGGQMLTSAGARDLFIARFNSAGNLDWVLHPQDGGDAFGQGGIAVDPAGNAYVVGGFENSIQFGTMPPFVSLVSLGGHDAFIVKYIPNPNGNGPPTPVWAQPDGGRGLDLYMDVALDASGNAYAAGAFDHNAVFCGSRGAMVAKYDPLGAQQWQCSASSLPAVPVGSLAATCAPHPAGGAYMAGWYQTATDFGAINLEPQGHWNFFLAEVDPPAGGPPAGTCFLRGDCNDDGSVDVADAVCILLWLFGGQGPPGCVAAVNANGDAAGNVADVVFLLSHLFRGGPPPLSPYPNCGIATAADLALGCTGPRQGCLP